MYLNYFQITANDDWLEKVVEHTTPTGKRTRVKVKSLPPEERAKYHPKHDKIKSLKDRINDKINQLKGKVKNIGTSLKEFPDHVKSFIQDKKYREKTINSTIKSIKKSPHQLSKKILHSAKAELKELKTATHAVGKFFKKPPEKLNKQDKQALYSTGVYVAGAVLATVSGGVVFATSAVGKSFTAHVAIKVVHSAIDSGFLHFEGIDTVVQAVEHVVHFAQKEEPINDEKLINIMIAYTLKHLKELTDEDVKKILNTEA